MASRRRIVQEQSQKEVNDLTTCAEAFLEANRVALEILGGVIPRAVEEPALVKARLGVVEDILDGACTRYTDS